MFVELFAANMTIVKTKNVLEDTKYLTKYLCI